MSETQKLRVTGRAVLYTPWKLMNKKDITSYVLVLLDVMLKKEYPIQIRKMILIWINFSN